MEFTEEAGLPSSWAGLFSVEYLFLGVLSEFPPRAPVTRPRAERMPVRNLC